MELGGNSGGFHGYRRVTQTTSDINMALQPPPPPNYHHSTSSSAASDEADCLVREQDRFMPIANVIRIMRKILPPHAKISDDAKETIQECVSEYISFVTSEANERCQREQRKTITAEDVLWAMSKLGFDDYIEPLTIYLHRYREFDGGERGSLRGEPLVKRMMDNPGSVGLIPGFPYGFFPGHVPPMNGFHHQAGADSSQGSVSCTVEPLPPPCNKD